MSLVNKRKPYTIYGREREVEEEKGNDSEKAPLTPKQKREVASIYFAVVAAVIIVISFFWHIVSLFLQKGGG